MMLNEMLFGEMLFEDLTWLLMKFHTLFGIELLTKMFLFEEQLCFTVKSEMFKVEGSSGITLFIV